ncbi:hypothetical protein ACLB2K_070585 [Fragaria x ananassa]
MNIVVGAKEDRHLLTGLHTVADISCGDCHEVLGWKYERAYEASQKYKEGKFIFEKSKIVKEDQAWHYNRSSLASLENWSLLLAAESAICNCATLYHHQIHV